MDHSPPEQACCLLLVTCISTVLFTDAAGFLIMHVYMPLLDEVADTMVTIAWPVLLLFLLVLILMPSPWPVKGWPSFSQLTSGKGMLAKSHSTSSWSPSTTFRLDVTEVMTGRATKKKSQVENHTNKNKQQ